MTTPFVRAQLDYYAVLEIDPSADLTEVNAAFRRLAWRYHPDRNPAPGATLQFQDINEAHQVLSDPERRAEYDAQWHPRTRVAPAACTRRRALAFPPQFAAPTPHPCSPHDPVCFCVCFQRVGGDLRCDAHRAVLDDE